VTIGLRPEQQRVIEMAVRSGAYENAGEVLDQALEIIREQLQLEDWMIEQREAVAAHVEKGFAQAERGESIDGDAAVEMLRRPQAMEDLDAISGLSRRTTGTPPAEWKWRSSPPVAGLRNIPGWEPGGRT
jgi:Arc/MetJ-type ribon-helix-helix transcriptional regulator